MCTEKEANANVKITCKVLTAKKITCKSKHPGYYHKFAEQRRADRELREKYFKLALSKKRCNFEILWVIFNTKLALKIKKKLIMIS